MTWSETLKTGFFVLMPIHYCFYSIYRVNKPPQTLDELGSSLELWESLNGGLSATEAKFPPLHDQFGILEKYEVAIPEDVSMRDYFHGRY